MDFEDSVELQEIRDEIESHIDLTELNKLEKYLKEHGFLYERSDENWGFFYNHQLIVYNEQKTREWDAICHGGSYGHKAGLLEIMGSLVDPKIDGDSVVGWLTADEVIERIENA